jgi:uncharacterized repeat protein (TIGR01451 family)
VTTEVTAILSPAETDGSITNVATVEAFDEYEHPVSDIDSHTVAVYAPFTLPDMQIVKSADRTAADPGDIITYTLTWTNVGEGASQGFKVVDDFDDTYLTVVDAGGGSVSGTTIAWSFAHAEPGESGSLTYKLQVDEEMPNGLTTS